MLNIFRYFYILSHVIYIYEAAKILETLYNLTITVQHNYLLKNHTIESMRLLHGVN